MIYLLKLLNKFFYIFYVILLFLNIIIFKKMFKISEKCLKLKIFNINIFNFKHFYEILNIFMKIIIY